MKQIVWIFILASICIVPEANANKVHRLISDGEITGKDVGKLKKMAARKPELLIAVDRKGRTPLELLVETSRDLPQPPPRRGYWAVVAELMLEHGANPNQLTTDQLPILEKAYSSLETLWVVPLLIDAGAEIDAMWFDSNGRTPLILLTEYPVGSRFLDDSSDGDRYDHDYSYGHTYIDALVRSGVDINHRDTHGNTAIFWAARNGHIQQLTCLLALGADWSIKNKDGQNAYDVAPGYPARALIQQDLYWREFAEKRTEAAARKFDDNNKWPYLDGLSSDYRQLSSDRTKQVNSAIEDYDRRNAESLGRAKILNALTIAVSLSTDPQPTKVEYQFEVAALTGPARLKPGRVLETVKVGFNQEFLMVSLRAETEEQTELVTDLYLTDSEGTNLGYVRRRAEWSLRETPKVSISGGFGVDLMFIVDRGDASSALLHFLEDRFSIVEYIESR